MSEKSEGIIIKKYANRRLYDTSESQYVTLEYLCELVKRGVEFKVIDAKSEEDLTRTVLTQIIFEQESKGYNMLPISFLRQIISFYDDSLEKVLPNYLEQSMHYFTTHQEKMRDYMGGDEFSPFKSFEAFSKQQSEWVENTWNMFMPFGGSPSSTKKDGD